MMTVLRNRGRWDVSHASFDGRGVTTYEKRAPTASMDWIDYGLGGVERAALKAVGPDVSDLGDLYHALARHGDLYGFAATERFYEIGTPTVLAGGRRLPACSAARGLIDSAALTIHPEPAERRCTSLPIS